MISTTIQEKSRISWIDNLKAIGIILVVIGHTNLPKFLEYYIYSFHIPMFFFISGYLFSSGKVTSFIQFAKKKFKSLIIPYLIFAVISYVVWMIINLIKYQPIDFSLAESKSFYIIKPIIGIFYSNGIDTWLIPNVALWFLTCLFVTEILFFVISKYIKDRKLLLTLAILAIAGFLDSLFMPMRLPWGIDVAITALVFYGSGYYFKTNSIFEKIKKENGFSTWMILVIGIIYSMINGRADMNSNIFRNPIFYYIAAFSNIYIFYLLANKIQSNKILSFIGKNTLFIMGLHIPVFLILHSVKDYLYKYILHLEIPEISIAISIVFTVCSIAIILVIVNFYRYMKQILEQRVFNSSEELT